MLPIRLCRHIGRRIDTFTNGFLNDSNNYKADDRNSDAGQNAQNHILRRYPSQQSNQHPDNDRILRISLSHSSSSSRIHSCMASKPIISNILSLNIKIRPTQKYNFSCEADFFAYSVFWQNQSLFYNFGNELDRTAETGFCKMFFTWYLTVFGDIYNTAAISS